MAANESVEIRMADLIPKTKRVDAIQCFVSQETPIVRIADADGGEAVAIHDPGQQAGRQIRAIDRMGGKK